MFKLLNFALFQATWFALVLAAAASRPWLGLLVFGLQLTIHLVMCARPRRELCLAVMVAGLGTVFDQPMTAFGVQNFTAEGAGAWIGSVPIWITALWASFALTLNASMAWLGTRYWLGASLGAVFGPLAYFGAASLGAVQLGGESIGTTWAALLLAIEWAIAMPIMLWLRATLLPMSDSSTANESQPNASANSD